MNRVRGQSAYKNIGIQLSQQLQPDVTTKGNITALLTQLQDIGGVFSDYQATLSLPIMKQL